MNDYMIKILCLVLAVFANTLFAVAKALKAKEFSWNILSDGLIEYILTILAISLIYGIGVLLPDFTIMINNIDVSLRNAVDTLMIAVIGVYAVKALKNFAEKFQIETVIEKVELPAITTYTENEEGKG